MHVAEWKVTLVVAFINLIEWLISPFALDMIGNGPESGDGSLEVVASELDVLAEHNYFAQQKQEHLVRQGEEKRKLDILRRKAKREEALKWRLGGEEALHSVTSRVHEIRFMLKPHHFLRQCMEKLSGYHLAVTEMKSLVHRHAKDIGDAHYLLEFAARERWPLHPRHSAKLTLMQRKVLVLRSIHHYHLERNFFEYYTPEAFHLRHRYAPELKLYRFLSRYFAQRVYIPLEMRSTLLKKRELLRQAQAKLQLIHDTQEKCAKIGKCKSRQHYNPKGCSNCGVIFMGGMLQGAIPYVISISRDTGVPTLVTLEFELQLLTDEERIQLAIVQDRSQDLHRFEQEQVYLLAVQQLQPWWSSILLYRRHLRRLVKIQHNAFYYRIRRLVRLKKDVDKMIIEPAPIDCELLGRQGRYVDLMPELEEYVTLQAFYKRQRIEKYAKMFQKKLHVMVDEARERKYQEWLRQQALANAPKPIVIKTLTPAEASIPRKHEKYFCYRAGCCRRKYQNPYHANMVEKTQVSVASFLTKDRYLIHLRTHQQEDEKRRAILDEHRRLGRIRHNFTEKFLDQLRQVREYLLEEMRAAILPSHLRDEQPQGVIQMSVEDEILCWANEGNIPQDFTPKYENTTSEERLEPEMLQESISSIPALAISSTFPVQTIESSKHFQSYSLFHHSYQLLHLFHPGPTMSLQLVSKHSSVTGPATIPLDRYLMRIGISASCELRISLEGVIAREKRVEDIHCLLYIQDKENSCEASLSAGQSGKPSHDPSLIVKVIDNYSRFGTYVVGENGAMKVSTRLAQGSMLTPGALLCIGVQENGPPELSVADASLACLVYKFHIEGSLDKE